MKRKHIFLLTLPALLAVFFLLNTSALSQLPEPADPTLPTIGYEEVFSAGDSNGVVYVDWLSPATNESAHAAWFLGAYRDVSAYGSNGVSTIESLCVDLDRGSLSNDLYYAIHYSDSEGRAGASRSAALYLNLLSTSGVVLAESANLLTLTNAIWYAAGADVVLLLQVPTADYPAAVLQLWTVGSPLVGDRSENASVAALAAPPAADESGSVIVHEGLLFLDDGSDLWSSAGQGGGTTNYPGGNSLSNFYDWVAGTNSTTSTNQPPGGGGNGGGNDDQEKEKQDKAKGVIYVSQLAGDDSLTGYAAEVSGRRGPKKTIRAGLAIAEPGNTLVIKTGNYNEDLNISGQNGLKVIIEGKVRL